MVSTWAPYRRSRGLPISNSEIDNVPQDKFVICRGEKVGWCVVCEDMEEEDLSYKDAEYDASTSTPRFPPFHLQNNEGADIIVFDQAAQFTQISSAQVSSLTRSVCELLEWQLANTQGEQPTPKTLSEAESNIVTVVALANKRLTTEQVIDALTTKYGPSSEGGTKGYLASLVRNGKLTNCKDAWGRGYGMPYWSSSGPVCTGTDQSVLPSDSAD